MQVDGLARVLALALEYSRTSTHVEKASAQHEHNTTAHVMSLNDELKVLRVKICTSIFKCSRILSSLLKGSQLTLKSALLTYINYLGLSITIYLLWLSKISSCKMQTYHEHIKFHWCHPWKLFSRIWELASLMKYFKKATVLPNTEGPLSQWTTDTACKSWSWRFPNSFSQRNM